MKKRDVQMALIFVGAALIIAFFMRGFNKPGEMVRIQIDGEVYGTYSLYKDDEIEIRNHYGYNKLIIKEGLAYMDKADCPDRYCVEHKPISETNETIVCLPHKLVVEIISAEKNDTIDGVSE
ncbi:MAG: NusG domain II-containing protein [Lachnospiraceae bacterium]|nr:NusG domain II-containing protein [Lachnospiraceae bacterium]